LPSSLKIKSNGRYTDIITRVQFSSVRAMWTSVSVQFLSLQFANTRIVLHCTADRRRGGRRPYNWHLPLSADHTSRRMRWRPSGTWQWQWRQGTVIHLSHFRHCSGTIWNMTGPLPWHMTGLV